MLLEMKNITKRFGAVKALNDVSLQLEAGEVMSLCGENGSGKSCRLTSFSAFTAPKRLVIFFISSSIDCSPSRYAQSEFALFVETVFHHGAFNIVFVDRNRLQQP